MSRVVALACAWIAVCSAAESAAGLGSDSVQGSGSGSSHSAAYEAAFRDCRLRDRREVNAERGFSRREDNWTHEECFYVCPIVGHGQRECSAGHHGADAEFGSHQRVMMWDVLFLILAVLVGALGKKFFPVWLPYTVGLLLIGCLVGGVALVLETRPNCPSFVLDPVYDANHDGLITRSEWDAYACADCHNQSACAAHESRRSCHDWGCAKFDDLDAPFRYSFFDTQAHNGHCAPSGPRRLVMASPFIVADCLAACNLVHRKRDSPTASCSRTSCGAPTATWARRSWTSQTWTPT